MIYLLQKKRKEKDESAIFKPLRILSRSYWATMGPFHPIPLSAQVVGCEHISFPKQKTMATDLKSDWKQKHQESVGEEGLQTSPFVGLRGKCRK